MQPQQSAYSWINTSLKHFHKYRNIIAFMKVGFIRLHYVLGYKQTGNSV